MILDFSEAQAKIRDDENKRRVEEGLTVGLTKEVRERVCRKSVFVFMGFYSYHLNKGEECVCSTRQLGVTTPRCRAGGGGLARDVYLLKFSFHNFVKEMKTSIDTSSPTRSTF
mmetsp:Transcript_22737/g.42829  ORF Transcript_22737/g.42829 Transcript_22737/m.42829 type:complete len:113 (-) Transcript_22737:2467-2805(-)